MNWINDKALDDIRTVGWHIMGIEGDETTPNVAHTIGLQQSYGYPYLKERDIEFARLYTLAYPKMGRPRERQAPAR